MENTEIIETTPVPSIVTVRMPGLAHRVRFYNDRFDVKVGDFVFAEGEYAGIRGTVVEVSTRFRVNLKYYRRIVSCAKPALHGEFRPVAGTMLVTCPSPELTESVRFSLMPPPEDDDEVVSGFGYELSLDSLEQSDDVSPVILARAAAYAAEGRVKYLSVIDGVGTAFVEGTRMYEVNFRFNGSDAVDIYCSCPYQALCKHSLAVILVLRDIMKEMKCSALPDFAAFERGAFCQLLVSGGYSVTI